MKKLLNLLKKNNKLPQVFDKTKTVERKLSKQNITTLVAAIMLVITHVIILLAIILSFRYYGIYPSLFGSVVAIVICLLIIVDIIFFIGFNHKDLALKIVSCVLAVFLLIGGTVGTYFVAKANGIVNQVLDSSSSKYETYSGVFVCYDQKNNFSSLEELKDKTVGLLTETENGITYIAKNILDETKNDYAVIEYKTNAELVQALIDGDVDAIAITSAYRQIYSLERDENSPFAKYLDNFIDFYSFEKELRVNSNKKIKNISTDPFNVLLIGYSRTDIGSPIGLADSIILATINPQTYTVSMMSIARDSFVPIPCYGGEYDKINSGRSTSRACFVETVEDFINTGRSKADHIDIDYYMELDYYGLVYIVNAIGGIVVNNPVDFELDGTFVPAGDNVFCDGIMALQFCRERHHMPNGDFDRQQHQKEVIIKIAEKFIQSGDINLALKAMEAASEFMSTDLTLNQLTTLFNLLLNTKNYTTLDTFDLVDFQTLRMTGSGGLKYYSYSMHLPLWVYLIYQGSFDESMQHVEEIMGRYKDSKQDSSFNFSIREKYEEPELYSLEYPDVFMFSPDPMPAYWADLEGMTLEEAMAWASANGVSLSVDETIIATDSRYEASLEGKVCAQSVRYGLLVSENKSGTITMMGSGTIDESKIVPDFVGHSYSKAVEWAEKYGIPYSIDFDTSADGEVGKVVEQNPKAYTSINDCEKLMIVVKAGTYTVKFDRNGHGSESNVPSKINVTTGDDKVTFNTMKDESDYIFDGWWTDSTGGTQVYSTNDVTGRDGSTVTVYAHWIKLVKITLNENYDGGSTYSIETNKSLPTPTRSHYAFEGWYDAATGGNKVTSLSSITSDTTLYAHWKEATKYSYSFVVDGTEVKKGQAYEGETPGLPEKPSKENYEFAGWSPTVGPISADTTYTAQWSEGTYDKECEPYESCTLTGVETETEDADNVGKKTNCRGTFNAVTNELISCSCDKYVKKEADPEQEQQSTDDTQGTQSGGQSAPPSEE